MKWRRASDEKHQHSVIFQRQVASDSLALELSRMARNDQGVVFLEVVRLARGCARRYACLILAVLTCV